jgi:2-polyprenyl-3-methyl-5-hydroxy-6-metoxy-1,4-benzoquinol methylase
MGNWWLMKDSSFQSYSRMHVHFYGGDIPRLLEQGLVSLNRSSRRFNLLDLGCGDGGLLFALHEKGLLAKAERTVGVDISSERIERLRSNLPFVEGIVADASNVQQLSESSFDFVICTQLIEHVENEQALAAEIARLLKPRGFAYVSSVIKKWWGIYIYFKQGSFRLDPTHIREYSSEQEFLRAIANERFETMRTITQPLSFPLVDLITRLLIRGSLAQPDAEFYQKHKSLTRSRKLRLRIAGFASVEALIRKPSK